MPCNEQVQCCYEGVFFALIMVNSYKHYSSYCNVLGICIVSAASLQIMEDHGGEETGEQEIFCLHLQSTQIESLHLYSFGWLFWGLHLGLSLKMLFLAAAGNYAVCVVQTSLAVKLHACFSSNISSSDKYFYDMLKKKLYYRGLNIGPDLLV